MKFSHSTIMVFAFSLVLSLALTGMATAIPQELVDRLGDENYHLREKAEQELIQWAAKEGKKSLSELRRVKSETQSPEIKSRLDSVIAGVPIYQAVPDTRGFIGVNLGSINGGSLIESITPNSPAAKAGLQVNDKIIELDGVNLTEKKRHVDEATDYLRRYVKKKKEGEKLTVKIDRRGKILIKKIKLGNYNKVVGEEKP